MLLKSVNSVFVVNLHTEPPKKQQQQNKTKNTVTINEANGRTRDSGKKSPGYNKYCLHKINIKEVKSRPLIFSRMLFTNDT